jgi:hypothetical protein
MTQPPLPPGYLRLHLQGNALIGMITPSVRIDGYPVPVKYGENVVPVHPGPHTVSANGQWMWKYGHAEQQIQVGPGETADLWYAAPVLTFMKGAMGPTKQRVPGVLGLVGVPLVIVALVVLIVVLGS